MTSPSTRQRRWSARLAQAAFWFFLVKGLLWLSVPAAIAWLGWQWGAAG